MADTIVNFLHLLATSIWIGGALFIHLVLQPSLASIEPQQAGKLMGTLAKRFSIAAWASILVLVITGILKTPSGLYFDFTTETGLYLLIKHLCIAVVIVNGLIIALVVVPKLRKETPRAGEKPSEGFVASQKRLQTLSSTNSILGLVILFCAASLGI